MLWKSFVIANVPLKEIDDRIQTAVRLFRPVLTGVDLPSLSDALEEDDDFVDDVWEEMIKCPDLLQFTRSDAIRDDDEN